MEGYSYNWTENLMLDGSKPLTLLEHVGGNPILAAVWRERYAPEDYDLVVKWAVIGYRYFEKYAVPEMSSHDRKKYEQFKELVRTLPGRIDRANREMLIPALADSQGALVLDAKLSIRKIVKDMPDPGKPMPMAEPALVVGVSNAELLRARRTTSTWRLSRTCWTRSGKSIRARSPSSRSPSRKPTRRTPARSTRSSRPSTAASTRRSSPASGCPTRWPWWP